MFRKGTPVVCELLISPLPSRFSLMYLGLTFLTSLRGLDMAVTEVLMDVLCAATRAHACVRACVSVWVGG